MKAFTKITCLMICAGMLCSCEAAAQARETNSSEASAQIIETSADTEKIVETTAYTPENKTDTPALTGNTQDDGSDEMIRPNIDMGMAVGRDKIIFRAADADKEAVAECMSFNYTYGYTASGKEYSSYPEPDYYLYEDYSICPVFYFDDPEIITIREGDKFGNLTVSKAYSTVFENDLRLQDMHIELEGEIEVTGVIDYYYDEEYLISSGNMFFYPLEGLEGAPLPAGAGVYLLGSDDEGTFKKMTTSLQIGNLLQMQENGIKDDWAETLYDMFGDEKANCSKLAKATLSNLRLEWSEQFGSLRCNADIVRLEAV